MKPIADFLFEAKMLKDTPRAGYAFLGIGRESVAEHSFMITLIGFVMSRLCPDLDSGKLVAMCLLHDLPESRISDLNYVHKKYVTADEPGAVDDMTAQLPFGEEVKALIDEFNAGETPEAQLAKDADQLSFVLELKQLTDLGSPAPDTWLPVVIDRLRTPLGKKLADTILRTRWDAWWMQNYVDG
ncbi:MAG: metal-dependent phosphohydrolase [Deltaproteobacteria bacterium]|nr:MAG: metal-dependent phosphohydrolase [Deltaproteobacteria bacterium]